MHKNLIDLSGQQFGKLLVIARLERPSKHKSVYWFCRCSCGLEVHVHSQDLREGSSNCCYGCRTVDDLIDRKFGRLQLIDARFKQNKRGDILRYCLCDCGNKVWKRQTHLKRGSSTSCGCLTSELASALAIKIFTKHGLCKTREYKLNAVHKRRELLKRGDDNTITVETLRKRLEHFNNKCAYCFGADYEHIDHIIPLSRGGLHTLNNIIPSCSKCNLSKHDKLAFIEWFPKINFEGFIVPTKGTLRYV